MVTPPPEVLNTGTVANKFRDFLQLFCYVRVQVNQDGVISVGDVVVGIHTPTMFPTVATSTPLMAAYWADVNTSVNDGRVYYRQVTTAGTFHRVNGT